MEKPDLKHIWVNNSESLDICYQDCIQYNAIALDTEFLRRSTFYPKLALLQLATPQTIYLIDPLTIVNWQSLIDLLKNEKIVKVMHACSEDLEIFFQLFQVQVVNLFDTQLGAAFSGFGFSLSYKKLVNQLFHVELDKDMTLSDWFVRPLSVKQVEYAALDVAYLLNIHQLIKQHLCNQPQWFWCLNACLILTNMKFYPDPEKIWKTIHNVRKLNIHQRLILKELCCYREIQARLNNQPRNYIIEKKALWLLAKMMPTTVKELYKIKVLKARNITHHGKKILAIIAKVHTNFVDDSLDLGRSFVIKDYGDLPERIKKFAQQQAKKQNIACELYRVKKLLKPLLISWSENNQMTMPKKINDWRCEALIKPLVEQFDHE